MASIRFGSLICFLHFVSVLAGSVLTDKSVLEPVLNLGELPNEIIYKVLPHQVIADFTDDYILPKGSPSATGDSRNARITKRAASPEDHVIEVFFIADYAAYQKWLKTVDGDINAANKRMEVFYQWIARSMNERYKYVATMSNTISSLQIKLVGLLILKDLAPSWTELSKLQNGRVNVTLALEKLTQWVKERTDIPKNDHIIAFTGYGLQKGENAEIKGLSTLAGLCTDSSMTILHDDMTSSMPAVAAHELGHSLGASHDKESTGCSDDDNYIMATKLKFPESELLAERPWQFSICSIRQFEETLSRVTCTKNTTQTPISTDTQVAGQMFTADEQCAMANSETSYISRNLHYTEGYDNMCRGMYCEVANSTTVSVRLPIDGTSCGHKKWCKQGRCIPDQSAPIKINNCPSGDNPRFVCHIIHCSVYAMSERKYQCCETCPVDSSSTANLKITKTTHTPTRSEPLVPDSRSKLPPTVPAQDPSKASGMLSLLIANNGSPTKVIHGNIIIAHTESTTTATTNAPVVPTVTPIAKSDNGPHKVTVTGVYRKPTPIDLTSGTIKVVGTYDVRSSPKVPSDIVSGINTSSQIKRTPASFLGLGGPLGNRILLGDDFWSVFNRWFNRCLTSAHKVVTNAHANFFNFQDSLYQQLNTAFHNVLFPVKPPAPIQPTRPIVHTPIHPIRPIVHTPIQPLQPIVHTPIQPIRPIVHTPIHPIRPIVHTPIQPLQPIVHAPMQPIQPIRPIVPLQLRPLSLPKLTMPTNLLRPIAPTKLRPRRPFVLHVARPNIRRRPYHFSSFTSHSNPSRFSMIAMTGN